MKRRCLTLTEKFDVLEKTEWRCSYCGCDIDIRSMVVDHFISLHNHGTDDLDNLVPACRDCNYYKGGCSPDGFRKKLKRAFVRERKCDFVKRLEGKYAGWNGVFYFERITDGKGDGGDE